MPDPDFIIGLDIGGTETAVLLGDYAGIIHRRTAFPTRPQRGFDPVFGELTGAIESTLDQARQARQEVAAISVSIGGPLDLGRGIVQSPPNLPGWDAIPLKQMLHEAFALPVCLEHDGNAGALAEWYFGAGRGCSNLIFLTMGTGFGAGLILNGALYRGASGFAGEVGHIRLAGDGPEAFGKTGSWEAFCAGSGIARLAVHRFPGRWRAGEIDTRTLAELALGGDGDARAVFSESGQKLGLGLAILIDILNPDIIVIGSLAHRLGDLVLAPARRVLSAEALPQSAAACSIVAAGLGERLGDVASLCAAIAEKGGPWRSSESTS